MSPSSAEVHNVSCQNSQDVWDFTIFGNQHLDVTMINVGSLAVEGVSPDPPNQITCPPNQIGGQQPGVPCKGVCGLWINLRRM